MMAGKGSKRRPRDNRYCTAEQEAERWERVFPKHRRVEQSGSSLGSYPRDRGFKSRPC